MAKIKVADWKNVVGSKSSKYGNEKTIYHNEQYDSKKEAEYARILDLASRATRIADRVVQVTRQVPYPVEIDGAKICKYIADFVVFYADGRREIVDVKGYRTEIYKLKKKLVEAIYKIKIIEV